MLGGSGAGKTCFMLAMYDVMSFGVEGFTFTTVEWDDGLDLEDQWKRLCDGTDLDRWPKGNMGSRSYKFRFSHGMKSYLTFEWLDYRGGALTGRSDDPDLPTLRAKLKESFGVFIVVPADQLIKDDYQAQRGLNLNRVNQLLNELRDQAPEKGFLPVVSLVVTKMDIWCKAFGKDKKKELVARLTKLFNPLFASGGGWTVSIVPVTLGEGLCDDMANAAIAPMAIHYPVTFTIHELYQLSNKAAVADQKNIRTRIDKGRNRPRTWWEVIFGTEDDHDPELEEQIAEMDSWAKICDADCKTIGRSLSADIPVFKNGEQINIKA